MGQGISLSGKSKTRFSKKRVVEDLETRIGENYIDIDYFKENDFPDSDLKTVKCSYQYCSN